MIYGMILRFDTVNCPILDALMSLGIPLMFAYAYLNLCRNARKSSHVDDFNNRNEVLNCQTSEARILVAIRLRNPPLKFYVGKWN